MPTVNEAGDAIDTTEITGEANNGFDLSKVIGGVADAGITGLKNWITTISKPPAKSASPNANGQAKASTVSWKTVAIIGGGVVGVIGVAIALMKLAK